MKFLRILVIIACLNVPFAYGMESSITQMIVNGAKQMVVAAGILCVADGILEIADGESLLPSFAISERAGINGACKASLGALLFVAGQPSE
jgi:hypothetical protein